MNHSTLWSLRGANCATFAPSKARGTRSSTDLSGQLGLENILSNLGKGRLPRPAKNAGLAMTESLYHPKRNVLGGEPLHIVKENYDEKSYCA
jgi:hypothetical protein